MSYFVLLAMVFCHIVDDYYLQGWLASAKQRKWWEENAPDKLYRYDYIVALIMHSMSWSFMIMLPIAISQSFNVTLWFFAAFIVNAVVHAVTDHTKANLLKINLIVDQSIHIVQILLTFILKNVISK